MKTPYTETHVHFHDLREPRLTYDWLMPGADEDPDLGDYGAVRAERYWPDDFLAETRFENVERVVHVQAAVGSEDPVEESRWLQAHHDRIGVPHGAIAGADLADPNLEAVLQGHLQFPIVRGIRDLRYDGYLGDERWEAGFGRLGELGLICCDDPAVEEYGQAAALAARHPQTTFCIDHCGFPKRRDDEYLESWRSGIAQLAAVPSVVMKISGLGMADHRWTVDSLRPWVLGCIEAFGVERCFFGTNWPLDRLFSSFGDVLDAYAELVAELPEADRRALFSDNARRIFRV